MTDPKWTKGTWLEDGPYEDGSWEVFTDSADEETVHIASVTGNRHAAYLITAAPSLYEALEMIASCRAGNLSSREIEMANAALAKARGETL